MDHVQFMNPPYNNGYQLNLLAKVFIFFLFFIIANSSFGSGYGWFDFRNPDSFRNSDRDESFIHSRSESYSALLTEEHRRTEESNLGDIPWSPQEEVSLCAVKPSRQSVTRRYSASLLTPFANQSQQPHSANFENLLEQETKTQKERYFLTKRFIEIEKAFQESQGTLQKKISAKQQQILRSYNTLLMARNLPANSLHPEKRMKALTAEHSHQQLILLLSHRLALYPLESNFLRSYLLKREILIADVNGSKHVLDLLNSKARKALNGAYETGITLIKELIPSFSSDLDQSGNNFSDNLIASLNKLTPPKIEHLNQVLDLARATQCFVLGCHTSRYITESKKMLDEIENHLEQKCQGQNEIIDCDSHEVQSAYLDSKNLCISSKATFSLMETISANASFDTARKSALLIQEQLNAIKESVASFSQEQDEVDSSRKALLKAEKKAMEELQWKLQGAELAYREIEDESWIDQICGDLHQLKKAIEEMEENLFKKAQTLKITLPSNQDQLNNFTFFLNNAAFHLDKIESLPQHPSLFLANVKNLATSLDQQKITATQGKIFLDTPEKFHNEYSEEVRREWLSAINLIRLALCRDFGFHIMKAFDSKHKIKIRECNPLTVAELKNFLFTSEGNPKFARSFFIPLEMAHEDFLKHLEALAEALVQTSPSFDKVKAHQVIKFDALTLAFNPFAKEPIAPFQESIETAELRQRQAGFEYIRKALERAFPEASLSAKQLEKVLEQFDTQFKFDHLRTEKSPLTLATTTEFIKKQKVILKNRSYWEKNISPYLDHRLLVTNALNGLSYTIGSHFGTAILFILPSLYLVWLNHKNHTTSSSA